MSLPKDFIHAASGLLVRIDADAGGGYFALVPALPGCGSQGDTIQETLENVNDAVTAVLELIRRDQPERYSEILGSRTSRPAEGSESSSGGAGVEIIADL